MLFELIRKLEENISVMNTAPDLIKAQRKYWPQYYKKYYKKVWANLT